MLQFVFQLFLVCKEVVKIFGIPEQKFVKKKTLSPASWEIIMPQIEMFFKEDAR